MAHFEIQAVCLEQPIVANWYRRLWRHHVNAQTDLIRKYHDIDTPLYQRQFSVKHCIDVKTFLFNVVCWLEIFWWTCLSTEFSCSTSSIVNGKITAKHSQLLLFQSNFICIHVQMSLCDHICSFSVCICPLFSVYHRRV